jgi:hypothetical protein
VKWEGEEVEECKVALGEVGWAVLLMAAKMGAGTVWEPMVARTAEG